jgi:hypothetical protein
LILTLYLKIHGGVRRRKKEEGRRKKEEGRRKKEEGREMSIVRKYELTFGKYIGRGEAFRH